MRIESAVAVTLLVAVLGIGCGSTSHEADYRNVIADLVATGSDTIALAVLDQRAQLRQGERPSYAGDSRTAAGIRIRVYTKSGRPLAEDMTHAICASLEQRGFACEPLATRAHQDEQRVRKLLLQMKASKRLLLRVRRWRTSTFLKTTVHYDLILDALDREGKPIATSTQRGRQVIEADDPIRPLDVIANKVPPAFKARLEALLNHKDVVAALNAKVEKPDAKQEDSPFD